MRREERVFCEKVLIEAEWCGKMRFASRWGWRLTYVVSCGLSIPRKFSFFTRFTGTFFYVASLLGF